MDGERTRAPAENKSSVISFQLSVTTAGKAIADSGQLIPNPQPRVPLPQPFPRGMQLFQLSPKGARDCGIGLNWRAP